MTEKEFLILYQKKRGFKNIHEAKEKINLFWEALFEALETNDSVSFRGWGIFEKKIVPARRIMNINTKKFNIQHLENQLDLEQEVFFQIK